MFIYKRDGTKQVLNVQKIQTAMENAGVRADRANQLAKFVRATVYGDLTVEEMQERIEKTLYGNNEEEAAKRYADYREYRSIAREKNSELMKGVMGIIDQTDKETLTENANKPAEQLPVMRDLIAGNTCKQYFAKHVLPKHIKQAHVSGDIYIHDMDYIGLPMTNCCLVDLKGMLEKGFKMGNAHIETPNGILTAASVTAQIIAQVACNQYGGTTIPNIDVTLAPYVEKEYQKHKDNEESFQINPKSDYALLMTLKDIRAAAQILEYEINTLFTSNGQTPFVTFTFGLGECKWSRELQKAILIQRIKGLGKDGVTPVFPKLVFWHKEGLNVEKDSPNYDIKQLAVKCTSRRMYPDHLSYDRLCEFTGGAPSPMGCRAFLGPHESGYDGRNNLGVVTVNIPRCAIRSNRDKEQFWKELDKSVQLAKEALNVRLDTCRKIQAKVAPILYLEGAFGLRAESPDEYIFERFFSNNRASISLGYIGLYDACIAMFGKGHHESAEAHDFATAVVKRLKKYVDDWKAEENIGYTLYGTPAEGLCGKFADADRKMFGIIENITDKGYQQNAFNIDVRAKINPLEKIELEKDFPRNAVGGFISYGELPRLVNNLDALEQIITFAMERTPYYGVNTPIDICHTCKFEGDFEIKGSYFTCPSCGNNDPQEMTVIKRVSGYLGAPVNRPFPPGKFTEVTKREKNL